MKINPAFAKIGLSPIVEISERARNLAPQFEQKSGKPFIYFQRGEVGFDTPDYVKHAIVDALCARKMTRYPLSGGSPEFKDAILKYFSELGIDNLNRSNILCTYGGQEGLQLAFNLFQGSRVVSFDPIWGCMLENILPYSRAKLDLLPFDENSGELEINFGALEKKLSEADILYLNNPHNPTGKVFSAEELKEINDLCVRKGITIISDEAYKDIVFDGKKHTSMLEFPGEHIISSFTFSKTFAATGLRVGYTITRNSKLVSLLTRGDYTQTAGVVTPNQHGFRVAIENSEEREKWIKYMVSELQGRRDAISRELRQNFDIDFYNPRGAFYFFLNLNKFIDKKIPIKEKDNFLLETFLENGIAIVPGGDFSKSRYQGYARISYSTLDSNRALEGIRRMKEVLDGMK